jgi:hypothetical protein
VATQETNLHLGFEVPALASLPSATRASPLLWLSLLCLDAPLVAISWQALFGRAFHAPVTIGARVVLFLTTWCIYLGDRLADVATLSPVQPCSGRQRHCRRHFSFWRNALVALALLDLACIVFLLDAQMIVVGLVLGVIVIFYLAANHFAHRYWRRLPLKEALVGTLFSLGSVAVFLPANAQPAFFYSALLLAAVCTLNCVHVAAWERPLDVLQRKTSIATCFPAVGAWFPLATWLLALLCAMGFALDVAPRTVMAALALSTVLLGALHASRLPVDQRTALADLALAIPLVIVCVST